MHASVLSEAPTASVRTLLDRGYTLPASWYTDPDVYADEQRHIFRRSWQYVGLTEQVASPGDFFRCQAGNVPLIVTRDEANDLHAHVNVCRHRGAELVSEACGSRKALQCPYHAWTYGLDGSLRAAPGMREEPGFNRGDFGLIQARIDTWGPFVFVNPDPAAPSLESVLAELPELTVASGLRLDDVKRRVRHHYDIAANWKVVVDNYLECYHCPVAHPGFSALIDTQNYTVAEYDYFSTQGGPLKEAAPNEPTLYDTTGEVKDGFYAFLWPNFTINVYPGPGILSINLFLPLAVDKTRA
ncbi:MAG TPA: aromatic ring-hydroxylating dioxygenase subunit alpha, partial [Thermomicrobiales bacterium]|nr:aromatic ring-hydroxylating dioxygenase subunit alpha [Thermomicrobiales bacterium]